MKVPFEQILVNSVDQPCGCVYCYSEISAEDALAVPDVGDDEEWERLAKQHAPDCDWIVTRAHRKGKQ